jgi:hypothetical protein
MCARFSTIFGASASKRSRNALSPAGESAVVLDTEDVENRGSCLRAGPSQLDDALDRGRRRIQLPGVWA